MPSSPVRMAISCFRALPLARFIVDHHWQLDELPLFILRQMDKLCASFALWTVLVAPSVAVLYALLKSAESGLQRCSRHAMPCFFNGRRALGRSQGKVSFQGLVGDEASHAGLDNVG